MFYENTNEKTIRENVLSGEERGTVVSERKRGPQEICGRVFLHKPARNRLAAFIAVCLCAVVVFCLLCMSGCGDNSDSGNVSIAPTAPTEEIVTQNDADAGQTEQTGQTQPENNIQEDKNAIDPEIQRNVNVFLSNFSEVKMPSFAGHPDVDTMIGFAYDHNYFNNPKSIEYGEYFDPFNLVTDDIKEGEYYGDLDFNHRISFDVINSTIKKYFNYDISEKEIKQSSYSEYYTDGYYYTLETGGHEPFGFAVAESVEHIGGNEYKVKFHIYNVYRTYYALGLSFTDDVDKYAFTENDLKDLKYENEYDPDQHSVKDAEGEAIITTSDIRDRKQFSIKEYNVTYYYN